MLNISSVRFIYNMAWHKGIAGHNVGREMDCFFVCIQFIHVIHL